MSAPLPPLNAVRSFIVAARRGSLTAAAAELHVTHGAVSRAISALEAWLDVELFRKAGRGLELTPAGRAYLAGAGAAFDQLAAATAQAVQGSTRSVLRVAAPPTLTVRWLIPRLPRFHMREPGVEVHVRTSASDQSGTDADLTLQRRPVGWRGRQAVRFLDESATPVMAPAAGGRRLRAPAELTGRTLIHAEARADAWKAWLREHAPAGIRPAAELRFDHVYLALQAALDGLGLAMGPLPLVAEDLAAGRLVAPFPGKVLSTHAYFAVLRGGRGRRAPASRAFLGWLQEEAALQAPPAP